MKLTNVRLSFAHLFEPTAFNPTNGPVKPDELKFKATFLIPKNDAQIAMIEAAIKSIAIAKWGAKAEGIINSIRGNPNKFCFQDGDTKEYDGYQGMMALTANNKARPLIIDENKNPLTQADGKPYSGCYVMASIEIFTYNNSGNGISASLKGVQFSKHGDAFSGGVPASLDDFSLLEEGAMAEDLV